MCADNITFYWLFLDFFGLLELIYLTTLNLMIITTAKRSSREHLAELGGQLTLK